MNFRIGHTIILGESSISNLYFTKHVGHKQKIIRNYNGEIITEFLDGPYKGLTYSFHENSMYVKNCITDFILHNMKQFSFVP